jgi:zinc-ribbon domain
MFFGLRGLILLAILGLLVFRLAGKFSKRSNTLFRPGAAGSSRNGFCVHCGAPLPDVGQFCGSCGARR